jgi:hypothetical protein
MKFGVLDMADALVAPDIPKVNVHAALAQRRIGVIIARYVFMSNPVADPSAERGLCR